MFHIQIYPSSQKQKTPRMWGWMIQLNITSTNRKNFNRSLYYIFFALSFNLDCISFIIVSISCKILKIRYIGTAIIPIARIIASNSLFSATSSNSIIFATNKIKASSVMRLSIPKSTHHPTNKKPHECVWINLFFCPFKC